MDTLSSSVNYHFVASDNICLVFDHYLMICLTLSDDVQGPLELVAEMIGGWSEVENRNEYILYLLWQAPTKSYPIRCFVYITLVSKLSYDTHE